MKHFFRQQSLQDLIKYNRQLLLITAVLAVSTFAAVVSLIFKDESWVFIPMNAPSQRISVSSNLYHESYLKEWGIFVMKELFSTSPSEVEAGVANLQVISSDTKELRAFYKEHLNFILGSNVSCAFFIKSSKVVENGVLVTGTFRYWFSSSEKDLALEKTYLLRYKRGIKKLLLLTGVEEIKHEDINNQRN